MTVSEFLSIDPRPHSTPSPVPSFVEGAEPGDVLQVDVLAVAHKGWGWSSVIAGLGFLKQGFSEPYLFHWQLDDDVSRSLAPAIVPLRPFCGVMGVAPAEDGEFRTRPPGPFGGNMDRPAIYAPEPRFTCQCSITARFFRLGDAHAAQGNGEVCINGIECPAEVSLRFRLHRQRASCRGRSSTPFRPGANPLRTPGPGW